MAAESAGRTLFFASFSPLAALGALLVTQSLNPARDLFADSLAFLTVATLATAALLTAAYRQNRDWTALRWFGLTLSAIVAQIGLAFLVALVWVAIARPERPHAPSPRRKPRLHGRIPPSLAYGRSA